MRNEKILKHQVCAYSGKSTVNKEVILTKYAIEYVKKMGYTILKNPFKE